MNDIVQRAQRYATEAHARINHLRKYTKQPYQVHLKAVADRVASVTNDSEVVAAAWLHDTVEDTPATFQDIEREFGSRVAGLVSEVTDVSRPSDGNRARRKQIDREHLSQASPEGKTIKLADLIDNCQDICRNDERFGRVFVSEMAELLPVLGEGDSRLYDKALALKDEWTQRWGLAVGSSIHVPEHDLVPPVANAWSSARFRRMFAEIFSAQDVAEPLRSFDQGLDENRLVQEMERLKSDVVGLRSDGVVTRYGARESDESGTVTAVIRAVVENQVVDASAMLSDVIRVLTQHEYCFVSVFGQISGAISRSDMQKPVVRMWLFGMITLIEMELAARIERLWPQEAWTSFMSDSRLDKARALRQERIRRGQQCRLLDCLQLSDKAQILMEDPRQLDEFGFASKRAAKTVAKELESLRNNLAHVQDIVTHDWPQIARMTHRMELALRSAD